MEKLEIRSSNRCYYAIFVMMLFVTGTSLGQEANPSNRSLDSLSFYFDFKDRIKENTGIGWQVNYSVIDQFRVNNPFDTNNNTANGELDLIATFDYSLNNPKWGKGKVVVYHMIIHKIGNLTTSGFGDLNGNITPINDSDPVNFLRQAYYRHDFLNERLMIMAGIIEPPGLFAYNRFAMNDRDKFMMVPLATIGAKDRVVSSWGGAFSFEIVPWLSIGWSLNELSEVGKYYSFSNLTFKFDIPNLGLGIYRVNYLMSDQEDKNELSTGWVLSFDQDLGDKWGVFFRYDNTSFQTLTSVLNNSMSFGFFNKQPFNRKRDRFGLGAFRTKSDQGGNFREWGVESFYKFGLTRWCFVTADVQAFEAAKAASGENFVVTFGGRIMFEF